MSDDTAKPESWSSADADAAQSAKADTTQSEPRPEDWVGFCQDCGKPLTQVTARPVGTGMFCDPCLTSRVEAASPASGFTAIPLYSAAPLPFAPNEPSPILAAILGFIPGVGAMYNGQFAKGIVHLAVFAILVSLSDNINGIFGLFVAGWIFYMAFEAYHTAVARREGLPLPNAFNLNDIGERMGFGKSWPASAPIRPDAAAGSAPPGSGPGPVPPAPAYTNPYTAPAPTPVTAIPVGTAPDWVGYVPPTAFASASYRPQTTTQGYPQPAPHTPYSHAPYGETYTGTATPPVDPSTGASLPFVPPTHRFPTGAIWLIGLGALILAANLLPDWKITERWWPPLLFAGLAVWAFTRRLHSGARIVCIVRWPVILMILAVMLALHAAGIFVTFGLICSVVLIAFGALLLLERLAGPPQVYIAQPTAGAYQGTTIPLHSEADEARSRAAWEARAPGPTGSEPGDKGGQ